MKCEECGNETGAASLINSRWLCIKCKPKEENRNAFTFIPGKGCAAHGYRKREQGKVVKRIMERGRQEIAKGN